MRSSAVTLWLAYALGALTTAAVALAPPLPRAAWTLLAVALAIGALLDRAGSLRVPSTVLTVAGVAGFLASLVPLHRETLAEQSLTALSCLLAVKFIGPKGRRDHLQVLAMALLLIAGSASLEPGLAFGVLLAAAFVLGVLQLLWLPFAAATASVDTGLARRLTLIGLGLAAASAPLTLALFVVLPRSVNPYWAGLGGRRAQAVSGISDHLELGEVGRVALSGDVAFRAEVPSGPLQRIPYWRGAVLEVTDGRRWEASGRVRPAATPTVGPEVAVTYFVEPHGARQLFLLESPAQAAIGALGQRLGAARVLQLPLPLARRIRYQGRSVPADRFSEPLAPGERSLNLQLPKTLPDSIRALAASVAGDSADPGTVAARLLAHFGRGYTYSLSVPPSQGDPLEAFLLRHRTGYCEYFASALTVMLRASGVPARIVSGYLGGSWVAEGSYYLVTQSSAHAWVEAYVDGAWTRLDPTPAAGELGGTYAARRAPPPRLWLDTLRMRWNSWVIQYDAESQLSLARAGAARVRGLRLDPRAALRAAAGALAGAALLFAAAALLRRRAVDPLARRLARFERLAARCGAARRPDEGPLDHAERFASRAPAAAAAVRRFGATAAACRYGNRPLDAATLARLDADLAATRAGLGRRALPCAPAAPPVE
jgi:transglutaminase-like putative cysteine protease